MLKNTNVVCDFDDHEYHLEICEREGFVFDEKTGRPTEHPRVERLRELYLAIYHQKPYDVVDPAVEKLGRLLDFGLYKDDRGLVVCGPQRGCHYGSFPT
jgi:hypothetical protein